MSSELRHKLASVRWREVQRRAAELGLDFAGARWVGPPASDVARARWYPARPATLQVVESRSGDHDSDLERDVTELIDESGFGPRVDCHFSDEMWGVITLSSRELRRVGTVRKLLMLDGDSIVLAGRDVAIVCDRSMEDARPRYEVSSILSVVVGSDADEALSTMATDSAEANKER